MSAELVPLSTHPPAALPAIGTPTVIDAWLRARNPNTVRGYHSDLERFREWSGAFSTAAAIEALLSNGQAAANLMVMNYVAALVERFGRHHDRPPACCLAIDGQDRPQDRPDELVPRRRGTEGRGSPRHERPGLARRPVASRAIGAGTEPGPGEIEQFSPVYSISGCDRRAMLPRSSGHRGRTRWPPAGVWIRGKGRTEKEH